MQIQENVSLQTLNTLSVPSIAKFHVSVSSLDELRQAITWANNADVKYYVLAGGSNTIPRDYIDGLVIQAKLLGITEQSSGGDTITVSAGAGENWHQLVMHCVRKGYFGIENLALIPGDCGAAPIQNIGAYGVELKDVFSSLDALNLDTLELETFFLHDCKFSYRDSIFKSTAKGKYIITSISLALSTEENFNLEYQALKDALAASNSTTPTLSDVAETVIAIRSSKLPDPLTIPNAGSFFKNPIVCAAQFAELQSRFPDIVSFTADGDSRKIAAAWLLDTIGWKGRTVHGVKMHDRHALVLTNPSRLSATKILLAADDIVKDVDAAFNIRLEIEPQILGEAM